MSKGRKIARRYRQRLAAYRESSPAEVQAGLKRRRPGSRNPRKVGRL